MEQTQWEMRKDNVGNCFTLSELGAPGGSEQEGTMSGLCSVREPTFGHSKVFFACDVDFKLY